MKRPNRGPRWLLRLSQVKEELKWAEFPRTSEEGLRQCAALSAVGVRLLREEIRRKTGAGGDEKRVEVETRRLLAGLSRAEARWISAWRKECARSFRR